MKQEGMKHPKDPWHGAFMVSRRPLQEENRNELYRVPRPNIVILHPGPFCCDRKACPHGIDPFLWVATG